MPALNFAAEFADAVASGKKKQAICLRRKRSISAGDKLVLYAGQRSKHCRRLLETKCTGCCAIRISDNGIWLDGYRLGGPDAYYFARADGFENSSAMREWFRQRHGLPFEGQVIRW